MKDVETQKFGPYLKKLNTSELEKVLATVLREMRRRDSDRVKGDVMAKSKALWTMRDSD